MSEERARQRAADVAVSGSLACTVVLTGIGLWARARSGPVWPAVLTDWTLGSTLLALSSAGVGAVVVHRLRRNVIGWLFLGQGVLTAVVFSMRWLATWGLGTGAGGVEWAAWAFAWVIPLNMTLLALTALLFPYGSPPSTRWRPAVAGVVAIGVASTVITILSPYAEDQTLFHALDNPTALLTPGVSGILIEVSTLGILISMIVGVAAVVRRMRSARGVERQQVKWFVFAAVVAVTTFIVGIGYEPVFVVATLLALPALPIAAGLAVLRYRLYDIDRVISRTVTYALLTIVLGAVYLGGVSAVTAVTSPLAGDSTLAVAASTLAAAAAFGPARRRIQAGVDRRFNRSRYDTERIVSGYRSTLRDEIDLTSLRADLLHTVDQTLQPADVLLWLPRTPAEAA